MNTIEFTLTKRINYNLKPFGKFTIKWNPSKKLQSDVGIISIMDVEHDNDSDMPVCSYDDDRIAKFMIKHKTDVLIDDRGNTYTRIGEGFGRIGRISADKIRRYKLFLTQTDMEDGDEAWEFYKKNI